MSVIGLDVGTSRVKAVRFDAGWHVVATAAETTMVQIRQPGYCEQNLPEVWDAAARVIAQVASDDVDLLAVTAQGDGTWLVDAAGQPVCDALLWNDSRAAGIVEGWQYDGTLDELFRASGSYGSPGLANSQLRWLALHEPDVLQRAATLLSCGSWIYRQATGEQVLHISEAANPFLDAATGRYSDAILRRCELGSYRKLLPTIVAGSDAVAPLTSDAAKALGLPAGLPVALAPYDVVSAAIGVGAVNPGDALAILGTTMCVATVREDPQLHRTPNGMSLPLGDGRHWLIAYATLAGTQVLDWVATLLGLADASEVVRLAATSVADEVPMLLPYLSPAGERAPFLDPRARGVFAGLSLHHTRADLARATVEGLTLAIRDCLAGASAASLALAGGGSRSSSWCQDISDATRLPVAIANTAETGARGAALAGSVAVGHFADLADATQQVVAAQRFHQPRPACSDRFDTAYLRMRQAREGGATHL